MIIRKLQRMLLVTMMIAALVVPMSANALEVTQKTIYVNGTSVKAPVIMYNNYQMVPAVWFQNLSASVYWSTAYHSAVVSLNKAVIGFPAGKNYADYDLNGLNKWKRDFLSTKNINYQSKIYVPLAYTAQKLGMQVTYNSQTGKTDIKTSTVKASQQTASQLTTSATSDEKYWLYKITEAEASGESYKGKIAVAASILNRVESPDWPNSIKGVIFQVSTYNGVSYYQYSPVLDDRIYNVTPSEDTKNAVHAALNGQDPTYGAVVFYNPDKTDNQWVRSREATVTIGNHIFAR